MAKAAQDSTTSVRLSLSEARARAVAAVGSPEFAETLIVRWFLSASDQLRFGALAIHGPLPGEVLKNMTRKEAEAEALRDLFSPGKFTINWEENWVRKRAGVFVFTAYGFWVDADAFEAWLLLQAVKNLPDSPPSGEPRLPKPPWRSPLPAALPWLEAEYSRQEWEWKVPNYDEFLVTQGHEHFGKRWKVTSIQTVRSELKKQPKKQKR
jgi:hypothetical protein